MINVWLESLHCHEETDEVGADEPYVLVTSVDLKSSISVAGFPGAAAGVRRRALRLRRRRRRGDPHRPGPHAVLLGADRRRAAT